MNQLLTWLQDQSLGLGDLEPLRTILSEASVVGFGDATHGTKEFCAMRHRMLEFLVTEMGFTILAIEASKAASTLINEYVVHADNDRASAVAELAFPMWDIEEFAETLEWLRSYNASVPDAKRVRFHGLDIWNTRRSRARVMTYLRREAPEVLVRAEKLFAAVGRSEARGMLVAHEHLDALLLARVGELEDHIASRAVRDDLMVIRQWIAANVADGLNNYDRSRYMAENLLDVLRQRGPEAKAIVWSHVFHVAVGFPERERLAPNMGDRLRKRLGNAYYAFALELDRGTYLAREWLSDDTLGDLKIASIPPAVTGSLAWHLRRTGRGALIVDLRRRTRSPLVDRWLATPQPVHTISWLWREGATLYTKLAISDACDGIVFVEDTSATTPTASARRAVRARVGH